MKCIECGITITELPEDATYEEMLCNECYDINENLMVLSKELERIILNFKVRNGMSDDIEITDILLSRVYEDLQHTSDSFAGHECEYSTIDIDTSFKRVIVRSLNEFLK